MTTVLTNHIQKHAAVFVMVAALCFGMFSFTPTARAETNSTADIATIKALIEQLLEQIARLQGVEVATLEGGFSGKSIAIGKKVATTDVLRVRSGASTASPLVGIKQPNSYGEVLYGPRMSNGYTWWYVDFDGNSFDGWVASNWLKEIATATDIDIDPDRKDVGISKFNATVNRVTDVHGPYTDFNWTSYGTSRCSIFVNGTPVETDLDPSGSHEISRTVLTEKFGKDYIAGQNKFELRCQSAYTEKDSTVSAYISRQVTIDSDEKAPQCELAVEYGSNFSIRKSGLTGTGYYDGSGSGYITVTEREPFKITWTSSNASYATMRGDKYDANGSLVISTGSDKAYEWTFYGEGGKTTCGVMVEVMPKKKVSEPVLSSMAFGFGVYEGSYPEGVQHSFDYHPQGNVEVYLARDPAIQSGQRPYTLVLSSYEPVKWSITGPGADTIGAVFATGYYDQEVTGIADSVPVSMTSHESGDSNYFFSYKNSGSNYEKLHTYVQNKYDTKFSQYYGAYSEDRFELLGYKG